MSDNEKLMRAVAEEVRLIHKELGWVLKHLANLYAMLRSDDNPPLEDPSQLKLFEDDNTINEQ